MDAEAKRAIGQRYRERHGEELRARARAYYRANREKVIARFAEQKRRGGPSWYEKEAIRQRAWKAKNRHEVVVLLGGSCCRCGFSDERALQIDHVNGGGYKALRALTSLNAYYRQIRVSI